MSPCRCPVAFSSVRRDRCGAAGEAGQSDLHHSDKAGGDWVIVGDVDDIAAFTPDCDRLDDPGEIGGVAGGDALLAREPVAARRPAFAFWLCALPGSEYLAGDLVFGGAAVGEASAGPQPPCDTDRV